jgi:hypothetical protein
VSVLKVWSREEQKIRDQRQVRSRHKCGPADEAPIRGHYLNSLKPHYILSTQATSRPHEHPLAEAALHCIKEAVLICYGNRNAVEYARLWAKEAADGKPESIYRVFNDTLAWINEEWESPGWSLEQCCAVVRVAYGCDYMTAEWVQERVRVGMKRIFGNEPWHVSGFKQPGSGAPRRDKTDLRRKGLEAWPEESEAA